MIQFFLAQLETEEERKNFETLWQEYEPKIVNIVLDMMRSRTMLQDVMQDIALKLIKDYDVLRTRHGNALDGRITVIAQNVVKDMWAKNQKYCERHEDVDDLSIEDLANAINIKRENTVFRNEIWDQVWDRELSQFVSSMPEKYRTILELSIISGYSNKEIAHILQIPESTVATRRQRALNLLRNQMDQKGVLP